MVLFLTIIIRYFSSKSTICCDRAFGKKIVDGVIPKENLSAYKQFEKGSHHSDNADFPEMNGNVNLENLDSYWESLR